MKAFLLVLLGILDANFFVCEYAFFDHIGQLVDGLLRGLGQRIHALGDGAHYDGHQRKHQHHNRGQLPVQVEQIARKGDQGQAVFHDRGHRLEQQHRAVGGLVDHGVGQRGGRMFAKKAQIGHADAGKHLGAQGLQAGLGDFGQRNITQVRGQRAQHEQRNHRHRDQPDGNGVGGVKALVQQRLE